MSDVALLMQEISCLLYALERASHLAATSGDFYLLESIASELGILNEKIQNEKD
jgi:hypothetical protein